MTLGKLRLSLSQPFSNQTLLIEENRKKYTIVAQNEAVVDLEGLDESEGAEELEAESVQDETQEPQGREPVSPDEDRTPAVPPENLPAEQIIPPLPEPQIEEVEVAEPLFPDSFSSWLVNFLKGSDPYLELELGSGYGQDWNGETNKSPEIKAAINERLRIFELSGGIKGNWQAFGLTHWGTKLVSNLKVEKGGTQPDGDWRVDFDLGLGARRAFDNKAYINPGIDIALGYVERAFASPAFNDELGFHTLASFGAGYNDSLNFIDAGGYVKGGVGLTDFGADGMVYRSVAPGTSELNELSLGDAYTDTFGIVRLGAEVLLYGWNNPYALLPNKVKLGFEFGWDIDKEIPVLNDSQIAKMNRTVLDLNPSIGLSWDNDRVVAYFEFDRRTTNDLAYTLRETNAFRSDVAVKTSEAGIWNLAMGLFDRDNMRYGYDNHWGSAGWMMPWTVAAGEGELRFGLKGRFDYFKDSEWSPAAIQERGLTGGEALDYWAISGLGVVEITLDGEGIDYHPCAETETVEPQEEQPAEATDQPAADEDAPVDDVDAAEDTE